MSQHTFNMKNRLKEYSPADNLIKHIDSYWSFRNATNETIHFPVVPDGCSDIVLYLNDSNRLIGLESAFITGVMETAELVPIPHNMELFGIRFNPGVLSYVLKSDMNAYKNDMCSLSMINESLFKSLQIDQYADDKQIVLRMNSLLKELLDENIFNDTFFMIVKRICDNPEVSINDLALESELSVKSIGRVFNRRIGLSPKKFARIMRFQKAHNKISIEGLVNLVAVALSSGYFDQAHFNHEYKSLVGFTPTNETMSILYNTK